MLDQWGLFTCRSPALHDLYDLDAYVQHVANTLERVRLDTKPRSLGDRVFLGAATFAGQISIAIVVLVLVFLSLRSWGTFRDQGLGFITGSEWKSTGETTGTFGILPMLYGSLLLSVLGLIIAIPTSTAFAYFIEFMAPKPLARIATLMVDLLAALPSVVIGLWGLFVLTPVVAGWSRILSAHFDAIPIFHNPDPTSTSSPFIAGWIVAIMIIPILTSVSREVMSRVDKDLINAAIALGGTMFTVMRRVILPTAKSGILGGILLGLGRALGETVAIYYVLNLAFKLNVAEILRPYGGSVASMIIAKFGDASPAELSALMAAGVVLFVVTLFVNLGATAIVERAERRMAS